MATKRCWTVLSLHLIMYPSGHDYASPRQRIHRTVRHQAAATVCPASAQTVVLDGRSVIGDETPLGSGLATRITPWSTLCAERPYYGGRPPYHGGTDTVLRGKQISHWCPQDSQNPPIYGFLTMLAAGETPTRYYRTAGENLPYHGGRITVLRGKIYRTMGEAWSPNPPYLWEFGTPVGGLLYCYRCCVYVLLTAGSN